MEAFKISYVIIHLGIDDGIVVDQDVANRRYYLINCLRNTLQKTEMVSKVQVQKHPEPIDHPDKNNKVTYLSRDGSIEVCHSFVEWILCDIKHLFLSTMPNQVLNSLLHNKVMFYTSKIRGIPG
jgi:hypothetical protein